MAVYSEDEPLTSEEREQLRETLLKDRRPAYIPWLVTEFGAQAGLFMSQLLFWDGKGHDKAGWIYKSEKDWRKETGLTRSAVRTARKILTKKGVLEEYKRGLPRRLYYRADLQALMAVLNGKPLPPTIEDPKDPEDLWDEDPWYRDEALEVTRRGEYEQFPVHEVNISQEGTISPTSEEGISRLTGEEGITSLPSEEPTMVPTSEENTTDLANTENTSENSTESLHRVKAEDSTLQVGAQIKNLRPNLKKK